MKALHFIGAAFAALMVGAVSVRAAGFVLNRSDSVPPGVWRVAPGAPGRGAIVLACPPDTPVFRAARRARYLLDGVCPGGYAPLLKPVGAVAGDRVVVRRDGVRVNGRLLPNTGLLRSDPAGRLLPEAELGEHVVPVGQVWLLSSYNRYSFDSRYYGAFDVARVRGVARPVYLMDRRG